MLPLVGIVAVGLLLVAGKLFFLSGLQSEKPALPVISSPAPVVVREKKAQAETPPVPPSSPPAGQKPAVVPEVLSPWPVEAPATRGPLATTLDVLAVPYDGRGKDAKADSDVVATPAPEKKKETASQTTAPAVVQPSQKPPVREQQTRVQTVKTVPPEKKPVVPEKKPVPSQPPAAKPGWMVQVGAFSTQAAADAVQQQLGKAGYTARIISGRTLYRVLVEAGSSRDEALTMATRIGRSGFEGAFIVPPRQ